MTGSADSIRHNDSAADWLPRNVDTSILAMPRKAFSTDSPYDILSFAIDNINAGSRVALCTLVEIRGGSSRPLGAHMAVAPDGRYCGYVSGGCTEAAVAAEALQAMGNGHDRFLMLGEGSTFFDIVLPCGGGITVAIHLVKNVEPLCSVNKLLDQRRCACLRYTPGLEELSPGFESAPTGWQGGVFVTRYRPKVRMVVSGRSLEVETAASVARAAGYDVFILEDAAHTPLDDTVIDPDTAVAVLEHDLDREMPILAAALRAKPFYIGALGSSRTHEKRVERLRRSGYSEEAIARIKAPIGLFGRAMDAQSLALSVIADIAASRQSLSHTARARAEKRGIHGSDSSERQT